MLRDYKLVQNQHKQLAGNSYIDDDLIFDHEDGTRVIFSPVAEEI